MYRKTYFNPSFFREQSFEFGYIFNYSRAKFESINCSLGEAIIVNVCLFYVKFLLDRFDFSSDFYALYFLRFA